MTAYQWNHTLIGWAIVFCLIAIIALCFFALRILSKTGRGAGHGEVHNHLHLHGSEHLDYLKHLEARRDYLSCRQSGVSISNEK
jgi:hypothetical protein